MSKHQGKRLELTNGAGGALVSFEDGATSAMATSGGTLEGFRIINGWTGVDRAGPVGLLARSRDVQRGQTVSIPAELWEGKTGGLTKEELRQEEVRQQLEAAAVEYDMKRKAERERRAQTDRSIAEKRRRAAEKLEEQVTQPVGAAMAQAAKSNTAMVEAQAAWLLYRSGGATIEEIAPLLDKALGGGAE